MLTFTPSSTGKQPLYEQLYRFLRGEIESGHIAEGEKLPSKRQLSSEAHLSVVTVETAYAQLLAEGYLRSENRRGYFVQSAAIRPQTLAEPEAAPPMPAAAKQNYRYDFATNAVDADLFPFATWVKLMREVLSRKDSALLSATHPQGAAELRSAIVQHLYHFRGISVRPEQIVVGAGSEYLLSLLVQLLGRDAPYAVEDPGYIKTEQVLSRCGAPVLPVPVDSSGLNVEALRRSGAQIAHVTPSHHFPLSIVMPVSRRRELLGWASEHPGRYVIEDDYDSEFRLTGRPIPALQSLDRGERVIYLNTFTKSLAPSLRISYMVLPPHLLRRFQQDFSFYSSTVPSFEQHTLALFMERGHLERHIWRCRKRYKARRDTLLKAVEQSGLSRSVSFVNEDAGLHLLMEVHREEPEELLTRRAAAVGIRLYPLSDYCRNGRKPTGSPSYIMGFARMEEEQVREAVFHLAEAWNEEEEHH